VVESCEKHSSQKRFFLWSSFSEIGRGDKSCLEVLGELVGEKILGEYKIHV
jgi:hypothetical protein